MDRGGSWEAKSFLLVLPNGWDGRPRWAPPEEFDALDEAGRAGRFTLAPGDKVTYRLEDGQVLTARVTEIDPERQQLRVLGDDNTQFDGTVFPYGSVLGRGGWAVPWLGWAAACLHTWPGIAAGAALTAMLALWLALPHWLKKADEQQDGPGEAEAEERRQAHV